MSKICQSLYELKLCISSIFIFQIPEKILIIYFKFIRTKKYEFELFITVFYDYRRFFKVINTIKNNLTYFNCFVN
jgi:hypothetical protein